MSAPSKPPAKKGGGGGGGGGWGSLLSGAVANLESRLDTILAEDSEASARQRASEAAIREAKSKGSLAAPNADSTTSREGSRSRVNDRLAERLAKATAAKTTSQVGSSVPSRIASPANDGGSPRASVEVRRSGEAERARSVPEVVEQTDATKVGSEGDAKAPPSETGTLLTSGLPINPARVSIESSRPSLDVARDDQTADVPLELQNGHATQSTSELEAEINRMRNEHGQAERQRQEEMHVYLEKIDALQAKLQYLAKETVAAAKEANASTSTGSEQARLVEKDERIALLMEEGEKLSKTELRHLQTIKKLRVKSTEEDRTVAEARKKLERAEKAEADLKFRLRRAEAAERQAGAKVQQISLIEKQVEELRVDRENASELIRTLTEQLKEAKALAEQAEGEAREKAVEEGREKIAGLENDLEDAQIEKKLAEDRAVAESKKVKEEMDRARERSEVREVELKNEIANLDSRVEAMRLRAEEASSGDGGGGGQGSSVLLMRQVETLQTQYAQAKGNWEVIEGSLTARVSALEGERDEATRREAEVRKKVREAGQKSRRLEAELETAQEQVRTLMQELKDQKAETEQSSKTATQSEAALADAKADFDRQRKLWDTELQQRIEEAKARPPRHNPHATPSLATLSPTTRKSSNHAPDLSALGIGPGPRKPSTRLFSPDLASLQINPHRTTSRRSSALPTPLSARAAHANHPYDHPRPHNADVASPALSRHQSDLSQPETSTGLPPPTPSIELDAQDSPSLLDRSSQSPQRTLHDLLSTSTAGAGPSVQLVERMSAAVRRLESEKAAFKDEIARLAAQRDDAREEVVGLMRAAEGGKAETERLKGLEVEVARVKERYEVCLALLGEREEEVGELREDLGEVKRIYRELVEREMPAS
ncbi:hypothetical protein B0A50_05827 [Salinomyces thailandicus]|uniref:TATA element modulatory factor 1 TATA binding domain-containing protein n=1 Tax=Salinomyces thailandicus TaxID=706561 RepID=A0A4U0TTV7_9PEZI|nr:hypothetical protein B0A50_05827 [Salinomyces thailandica]